MSKIEGIGTPPCSSTKIVSGDVIYECDYCLDQIGIHNDDPTQAERIAKAAGWSLGAHHDEDYCPKCSSANLIIGSVRLWTKKKLRVELSFKWFDLWIGFFYNTHNSTLYVCPLPMIAFSFRFDKIMLCSCGETLEKTALDTGEGIWLFWDCPEGCLADDQDHEELQIEWPFPEEKASIKRLEEAGFNCV